ncbi:molybdenum cofactor cytidylyltransferase, partial [Escherichia sp. S69_ASV_4]|nr:molybdenum cofactor cytidylyltransferase [Escherichia sp. S69_ASV_4]
LVSKPCLMQAIQRPNVTNMRQALLMGAHYSVEIENAEIILDIDTPDDFITAQKRYTKIYKM